MNVVIIGSGNVATVFAKLIYSSSHSIIQVLSRNENHAKELASLYNSSWGTFKSTPYASADLYILAISDNSLAHLELYPSLGKKLVVHTAGSVSMDVLKEISENYGVIYPLQSLTKNTEVINDFPIMINGNSKENLEFITNFAKTLSSQVSFASDAERLKYHIAAVIVNNFTNHLYTIAENFCEIEHIDFHKLYPIINETTRRILKASPKEVQTGPALREDIYTMGKHLKILTPHIDIKYLYLKLSESILKFHQKDTLTN